MGHGHQISHLGEGGPSSGVVSVGSWVNCSYWNDQRALGWGAMAYWLEGRTLNLNGENPVSNV